jgi:hypothetical protein
MIVNLLAVKLTKKVGVKMKKYPIQQVRCNECNEIYKCSPKDPQDLCECPSCKDKISVEMLGTIDVNGTFLVGKLHISYEDLCHIFGEPNSRSDGYKTDYEWAGYVNDKVFTIYNWKNGKNYCGNEGLMAEDIKEWHIGGKSGEVVSLIDEYIERGGLYNQKTEEV